MSVVATGKELKEVYEKEKGEYHGDGAIRSYYDCDVKVYMVWLEKMLMVV